MKAQQEPADPNKTYTNQVILWDVDANKQVGETHEISGKAGESKSVTLTIPANYHRDHDEQNEQHTTDRTYTKSFKIESDSKLSTQRVNIAQDTQLVNYGVKHELDISFDYDAYDVNYDANDLPVSVTKTGQVAPSIDFGHFILTYTGD